MQTPPLRLSPSGPVITNEAGAPLTLGPGARIRLTEVVSVMVGDTKIPECPETISGNGFGKPEAEAIVIQLEDPNPKYRYRANISLDLVSKATTGGGVVILYLDASIDAGKTFRNVVKNSHHIGSGYDSTQPEEGAEGRQAQLWMPMVTGQGLGIPYGETAPSIQIRGRAQLISGPEGIVRVNSNQTETGDGWGDCKDPVSGLIGTIHYELEECF